MMGFGYGMMGGWGPGFGYGYGSNFASGYSGGYWWTGLIGLGIQLLSWILIIAVGVAIFRWIGKRIPASSNPYTTGDALSIISERYARGEINKNEYMSLRKDILN
jgi:putative membrane protein